MKIMLCSTSSFIDWYYEDLKRKYNFRKIEILFDWVEPDYASLAFDKPITRSGLKYVENDKIYLKRRVPYSWEETEKWVLTSDSIENEGEEEIAILKSSKYIKYVIERKNSDFALDTMKYWI